MYGLTSLGRVGYQQPLRQDAIRRQEDALTGGQAHAAGDSPLRTSRKGELPKRTPPARSMLQAIRVDEVAYP
jgi:hypothetical protein